jgi:hypothetical protein
MPPTLRDGKICYVEFPAVDANRSADFYAKVFGWGIRKRGDGKSAFDDSVGEVSGTWVTGRKPAAEPGLLVYVMVDDIAEHSCSQLARMRPKSRRDSRILRATRSDCTRNPKEPGDEGTRARRECRHRGAFSRVFDRPYAVGAEWGASCRILQSRIRGERGVSCGGSGRGCRISASRSRCGVLGERRVARTRQLQSTVSGRRYSSDDLDRAGSRCGLRADTYGRSPIGRGRGGSVRLAFGPCSRSIRPSLGNRTSTRGLSPCCRFSCRLSPTLSGIARVMASVLMREPAFGALPLTASDSGSADMRFRFDSGRSAFARLRSTLRLTKPMRTAL